MAALAAAALGVAAPAAAKSYHLTSADETFRIQRDGSVRASEALTFEFSGQFHGADRLIPVAGGEGIDDIQVSDGGAPDFPGANARVGSSGVAGSYGVMKTPSGWTQVAWHFSAADETRTFVISYRMRGYVRAYSDIGNLYLQVWGDQWPVRLDHLHAVVVFPGPATKSEQAHLVRAWGHPGSVQGDVAITGPDRVTVDASNIPAKQFVEVDTTFPRRLLASTGNFVEVRTPGLALVTAREKRIFVSPYGPSPSPVGAPKATWWGGGVIGLILLTLCAPFFLLARLFGFGGGSVSSLRSGAAGLGGSFGGFGGGGGGGGGGSAW